MKSSKTEKTTNQLSPNVQADLEQGFGLKPITGAIGAAQDFNQDVYTGDRNAGLSTGQTSGINSLLSLLNSNPLSSGLTAANSLLSGNAVDNSGLYNVGTNLDTGALSGVNTGVDASALSGLNTSTASSLMNALNTAATDASNRVASQFNLGGRVGDNSAFGQSLSRGITDSMGGIMAGAAESDANRALQKALGLVDASGASIDNALTQASGLVDAGGQGIINALNKGAGLVGASKANAGLIDDGIGSLLNLITGQSNLAGDVIDAGGLQQDVAQGDLDAASGLVDDQNNASLMELNALFKAAGLGQLSPTSSTTKSTKNPGFLDFLTALGEAS
jgi:hypothetical protein